MQYPNITEYIQAVKGGKDNFEQLASLTPVLDSQQEPVRSVGGFAVVFKMEDPDTGKQYAVKCFTEDQEERDETYKKISAVLGQNKSPYLLGVKYLPKELFVDTKVSDESEFPVLQMDWVDGETMETYIASHYRDTDAIYNLYKKFCDLAVWLRSRPFAHGDMKPDNIMIQSDGRLVLVDYDGMYVPELKGKKSPTLGTRGFSHPLRTPEDFDEDIDDFALASMSISLLAMSQDSSLYNDLNAKDTLLMKDEDYRDFIHSNVYNRLMKLGGLFPKLLDLFSRTLEKISKENKKIFDQIFDVQTKAPEIKSFACIQGKGIYKGTAITLHWDVENATVLQINGKDVTNDHDYSTILHSTQTFILKASNGLKDSTAKVTISALEEPAITLKSDKQKLRRGKEDTVRLSWDIKNAKSAVLKYCGNTYPVKLTDEKDIKVDKTSAFTIETVGLDGEKTFNKQLSIGVFDESIVVFDSDKTYTLPDVPVILSWDVKNAKKVSLEGYGVVSHTGTYTVNVKEKTTYTLDVTDEFGTKKYTLEVNMLPLPVISSVFAPTPKLESSLSVRITAPKVHVASQIPQINIETVNLKVPEVPSLVDLGLNVSLEDTKYHTIGVIDGFRRLFKHIKQKTSYNGNGK
jgi:serine/threonine protein kinase